MSSAESYKEYTVGSGETLYSIAKKHNMTLVEIIKLNDIKPEESMVKFGQKIKVSSSGGVESHKSIEESKSSGNGMVEKEHIVGADETLSSISKQYNLKMKSILDLNNLGVDAKLKFGQKIKVLVEDDVSREEVHAKSDAKKEPYHVSKNCHGEYAVKAGDTLLGIKNKLEVNLNEMLEENNLTLNGKMKIGQKIKYKKSNCEPQNDTKKEKSAEKKVAAPVKKSGDKDVSENEDDDERVNIGSGSSVSAVVPTPSVIPSASKSTKSKAKVDDSEEDVVPQVAKKTSKSDFIYPVSYSSIKNEHDGMVFNVKSKETVKSSSRGKVVYIGNDIKAIATLVMVSSEDGYVVLYGNMGSIKVKNGQSINQGDVIGNADGSKAYFAIRKNGKFVNPESVLDK